MKTIPACAVLLALFAGACLAAQAATEEGFVSLFDGKTFNGWRVGKNPESFTIRDGMIVVNGPVAHLFYVGDVQQHEFKNFHFKAEVMTLPNSNSGIYFHTRYQEEGFPKLGMECQVNNSHRDWRRTGSLYGVLEVSEAPPANNKEPVNVLPAPPARDNVWFTQEIIVQGTRIVVKIDSGAVIDFTDPDADREHPSARMTWLPRGTFALQGHDPGSTVYFRNIRVKVLPD